MKSGPDALTNLSPEHCGGQLCSTVVPQRISEGSAYSVLVFGGKCFHSATGGEARRACRVPVWRKQTPAVLLCIRSPSLRPPSTTGVVCKAETKAATDGRTCLRSWGQCGGGAETEGVVHEAATNSAAERHDVRSPIFGAHEINDTTGCVLGASRVTGRKIRSYDLLTSGPHFHHLRQPGDGLDSVIALS
jgi:hypothetical protein